MSDLELMRERLLEATLARPGVDEALVARVLERAKGVEAPPAPVIALPERTWAHSRLWLEAAALLAVVSLLVWAFVRTDEKPPANVPAATPANQAPANIEPLPGAEFETGDPPSLSAGLFWLTTGAPVVRVGQSRVEMLGGRAMLKVGVPDAKDAAILNPWLDGHPQAATVEERKMLLNTSKWLIHGALALCLVAGAIEIDGEIIRAQGAKNPDEAEIDDYFLPTDLDGNGNVSWEECLKRDRAARKNEPSAKDEKARKQWLARYQWRIDREEFLFADKNDDMKLSRAEWRVYLDSAGTKPDEPEERLTDGDLLALCKANTKDQWQSLLKDADKNDDTGLSSAEIKNHFLFLFGDDEDAADEEKAFLASFAKADANRDGRLSQEEYAVFSAAEHRRDVSYYADYLIYVGQEESEKTEVPAQTAAKPNKVKVGTVWYVRTAKGGAKPGAAEDGTEAREWTYTKFTVTEMSKLGFKAKGYATDAGLQEINTKDESTRQSTWSKGAEPSSPRIEMIKVGDVELECYVYEKEYEHAKNGGKPAKYREQSWVLTTCPMIVVKLLVNGSLIEETLKFEE